MQKNLLQLSQEKFTTMALEAMVVGGRFENIWSQLENAGAKESEIKAAFSYAFEYFKCAANTSKMFELGKAKMRLELLYLRAMATQNYPSALAVIKETNKLNRLYAPTRSERKEVFEDIIIKKVREHERKKLTGGSKKDS